MILRSQQPFEELPPDRANLFEIIDAETWTSQKVCVLLRVRLSSAWRIIPGLVSIVRITSIYKPWNGHVEGAQPYLGGFTNHGY